MPARASESRSTSTRAASTRSLTWSHRSCGSAGSTTTTTRDAPCASTSALLPSAASTPVWDRPTAERGHRSGRLDRGTAHSASPCRIPKSALLPSSPVLVCSPGVPRPPSIVVPGVPRRCRDLPSSVGIFTCPALSLRSWLPHVPGATEHSRSSATYTPQQPDDSGHGTSAIEREQSSLRSMGKTRRSPRRVISRICVMGSLRAAHASTAGDWSVGSSSVRSGSGPYQSAERRQSAVFDQLCRGRSVDARRLGAVRSSASGNPLSVRSAGDVRRQALSDERLQRTCDALHGLDQQRAR